MAFILPFLPAIIAGGSALASAGVQIAAGKENKKFLKEQRGIEKQRLSERLADNKRRFALIAGAQEQRFGSSGLELTGTPLDVLGDTMVQRARNEAALRLESKQRISGVNNRISQQDQQIAGGIVGGIGGVASAGADAVGLLGNSQGFNLAENYGSGLTFNQDTGTFSY